jgi:hypothetical protein
VISVKLLGANSAHLRTCITEKQKKKKVQETREQTGQPTGLVNSSIFKDYDDEEGKHVGAPGAVFSRLRGNVVQLLLGAVGDGETEYDKGR